MWKKKKKKHIYGEYFSRIHFGIRWIYWVLIFGIWIFLSDFVQLKNKNVYSTILSIWSFCQLLQYECSILWTAIQWIMLRSLWNNFSLKVLLFTPKYSSFKSYWSSSPSSRPDLAYLFHFQWSNRSKMPTRTRLLTPALLVFIFSLVLPKPKPIQYQLSERWRSFESARTIRYKTHQNIDKCL